VTAWVLGRALLIGIVIGVLAGPYPAWRAAHLSPAHALQGNNVLLSPAPSVVAVAP
jgi:ABC-type antimicrobial peptide transport system permease subunit